MKNNKKCDERECAGAERAAEILGVSKDVILGAMIVTVTGKTDVYVENYKNIIEYTNKSLKLQGKNTRLKISGEVLDVDYFTKNGMKIRGRISEIKFY